VRLPLSPHSYPLRREVRVLEPPDGVALESSRPFRARAHISRTGHPAGPTRSTLVAGHRTFLADFGPWTFGVSHPGWPRLRAKRRGGRPHPAQGRGRWRGPVLLRWLGQLLEDRNERRDAPA
jgi:hypothetical protein